MYSGITQGLFNVVDVDKKTYLTTYIVELNDILIQKLEPGSSISIDGVCQTVVAVEGKKITLQAILETLSKTTLQDLYIGRKVSVERSLCVGDENGGHELAGHIVEAGRVVKKKIFENNLTLSIQCSSQCYDYIFEKGFIGLDGSSLTVGKKNDNQKSFDVHLIPETLRMTNFGTKAVGERVNIELDARGVVIAKSLERLLLPIETRLNALEQKIGFF